MREPLSALDTMVSLYEDHERCADCDMPIPLVEFEAHMGKHISDAYEAIEDEVWPQRWAGATQQLSWAEIDTVVGARSCLQSTKQRVRFLYGVSVGWQSDNAAGC